jgi:hypothetical protein
MLELKPFSYFSNLSKILIWTKSKCEQKIISNKFQIWAKFQIPNLSKIWI